MDLAAGGDDLLAVRGEVVDQDVEQHVARPRAFAVGLDDAAVDAAHLAFGAGLYDAIVDLRMVLDLPVKDLGVEVADLRWLLRHQLPVDDGIAHLTPPGWASSPSTPRRSDRRPCRSSRQRKS